MAQSSTNPLTELAPTLVWRKFSGSAAVEIYAQCRPEPGSAGDISRQAASIYDSLRALLRGENGHLTQVIHQTVFFRNIQRDFEPFRKAFLQSYEELCGTDPQLPATTFIEQPPLDTDADIAVNAMVHIPHAEFACKYSSSFAQPARVLRLGDQEHLFAGSIYGEPGSAYEETLSMFQKASETLAQHGMRFQDVCRTWIYLRHMERDYAGFNLGRREFFGQKDISLLPASTGIYGSPYPASANIMLSFYAAKDRRSIKTAAMNTPTLNEACSYGSDFSRGLRVEEANKTALYISGTASVDEAGRTAYVDDFPAQVERMLLNVETLLAAQRASFDNVLSAITYLKSPRDAPALRRILEKHGLAAMPNIVVQAEVCRTDLLCEMEAIAALPSQAPLL